MTARYDPPILTIAVLAYRKEHETRQCLLSLRDHVKLDRSTYQIVLLENGSEEEYAWKAYQEGLCDVVMVKRRGYGGGVGQTDLLRYSPSTYTLFVQCDQALVHNLTDDTFDTLTKLLVSECDVVDLNGDQSARGVWTDRAHLIKTDYFNSLAPFPNGGPGLDAVPWNEAYLQTRIQPDRIAHVRQPIFFADTGKWSVREAGDGVYKHRCDSKTLFVIKQPTYRTDVYPPLNDEEWARMLAGQWVNGDIPEAWKAHSFTHPGWRD